MGYRDLMLHLSGGDDGSTAERIHYAAALAAHGGAHLTGLFTRLPLPLASHYVPPALIAGHRAEIDRAAAAARQLFEDSLRRYGIAGEWIEAEGSALDRSEEHTSELQSLMRISYAVFCLKKTKQKTIHSYNTTRTTNTT